VGEVEFLKETIKKLIFAIEQAQMSSVSGPAKIEDKDAHSPARENRQALPNLIVNANSSIKN